MTAGWDPRMEYLAPARQGWRCPECGRVYAPWVMECPEHVPAKEEPQTTLVWPYVGTTTTNVDSGAPVIYVTAVPASFGSKRWMVY